MVPSAYLVDVYETLVHFPDAEARRADVAKLAGVDPDRLGSGLLTFSSDLDRGLITVEDALTRALADCGATPRPGLFEEYRRIYSEGARLFPDAMPFLVSARERGVPVALVSNCTAYTRPMLETLGVLDLVDVAVLSCEIGHAKPSPEIYARALESLGVPAADAVFVDDQLRYCAGAVAAGVAAVQILRAGPGGVYDGIRVVRSLMELTPGYGG
jgi:HAD superfamily hydrolase (TIGR01509 family)